MRFLISLSSNGIQSRKSTNFANFKHLQKVRGFLLSFSNWNDCLIADILRRTFLHLHDKLTLRKYYGTALVELERPSCRLTAAPSRKQKFIVRWRGPLSSSCDFDDRQICSGRARRIWAEFIQRNALKIMIAENGVSRFILPQNESSSRKQEDEDDNVNMCMLISPFFFLDSCQPSNNKSLDSILSEKSLERKNFKFLDDEEDEKPICW